MSQIHRSIQTRPNQALLCASCLLMTLTLSAAGADQALSDQFIALARGENQIKHFRVAVPAELFFSNGKKGTGQVFFEGAIQGDTYWIMNCTNSSRIPTPILPGDVVGMSRTEYWMYSDASLTRSPRGGNTESPQFAAEQVLLMVRQALGLGLVPTIDPASLRFSGSKFVGTGANGEGKISGDFWFRDSGQPLKCVYTAQGLPTAKVEVIYEYPDKAGGEIPSVYRVNRINNGKSRETHYFRILQCDFGSCPTDPDGFTVEAVAKFVSRIDLRIMNAIGSLIYSNDNVYRVSANGSVSLVPPTPIPPPSALPTKRGGLAKVIVLSVLSGSAILLIRSAVRRRAS